MEKVLYVGSGGFPFENARSMRMRSFCSLFGDLGYEVDVVSDWNSAGDKEEHSWRCLVSRTRQEYQAVNHLKRLSRYFEDIKGALESERYCFAFVTEMPERVGRIQALCKKYQLPIIGESCEWYDSSTWKYGAFDPHNIAFQLAHKLWYTRWDAVVSITNLLDDYYTGCGVPSVVVPTILDVRGSIPRLATDADSRDVNLLFAGSFGGTKDGIAPMAEAALECVEARSARKVVINVLGPSAEQVRDALGNELYESASAAGVLVVHPRVSQEKVVDYWRWADYGLFLRPHRRSSDAGFPTKLGEGMAVGTPFITNKTGDIPHYVRNGRNGFLLEGSTKEECNAVVDTLLAMSDGDHAALRLAARRCAERSFDYRVYRERMAALVLEADERRRS